MSETPEPMVTTGEAAKEACGKARLYLIGARVSMDEGAKPSVVNACANLSSAASLLAIAMVLTNLQLLLEETVKGTITEKKETPRADA